MAFEELKQRQSKVWGTGPYERLPEHYQPLLDHLASAIAPQPGEKRSTSPAAPGRSRCVWPPPAPRSPGWTWRLR
jgi:hypothetical protein